MIPSKACTLCVLSRISDILHSYQEAIPEEYQDVPRWYLLDTNLDPPWPWKLGTQIPVFSMALVEG